MFLEEFLRSVIGPENSDSDSRHSLKQSDVKHKLIAWSPAFSRVWACSLCSEYCLVSMAVMGRSHYFGFDFTILDRIALYYYTKSRASDDEQDESPDSGENEPLLRSRVNKSESYTGVIWKYDFELTKSAHSSVSRAKKLRKPMICWPENHFLLPSLFSSFFPPLSRSGLDTRVGLRLSTVNLK